MTCALECKYVKSKHSINSLHGHIMFAIISTHASGWQSSLLNFATDVTYNILTVTYNKNIIWLKTHSKPLKNLPPTG